jgi:hypothetical protein
MFTRRLLVLGAIGVLGVTGLAGSALASDNPGQTGTAVCTTSDGKTFKLKLGEPIFVGSDGKIGKNAPAGAETPHATLEIKEAEPAKAGGPKLDEQGWQKTEAVSSDEAGHVAAGEPGDRVDLKKGERVESDLDTAGMEKTDTVSLKCEAEKAK